MYDPGFSYSGMFHRICWECDEGKDPHGHGLNYSELNECSRGNRYVISGSAARGGAGRTSVDIHPLSHSLTPSLTHSLTHPLVHSPYTPCSVLTAQLRMHENDERFSDSSRVIVRFGCDYDADGFNLMRKHTTKAWQKKMLRLFDDSDPKDPEKKSRSERLLRAYIYELTHPERRRVYEPKTKGSLDNPVKVLDPESLEELEEVAELSMSAEDFHREATEAFEIFRRVINGDAVRGFSSAIMGIMPKLLELQKDATVLVLINYPEGGRHTPPVSAMNAQKSHTHKKGDNMPSVWWYDDAVTVYNYVKRLETDGFNKILQDPQTGKEVPRAVPRRGTGGTRDLRTFFEGRHEALSV